mmetsp:Transcript_12000/g.18542  ORF Transcript_12000/g.18542 Transcript_12000/m.18542 type:complete len:118 (-) Transcript_12000:2283-2636(-)
MRNASSTNPSINFNLKSAEFQQQQNNMKFQGGAEGGQQNYIGIGEFKPSKFEAPQSPYIKVYNQSQVTELLAFQEEITDKIKKAVETDNRIRISDLLDDQITEVDEFVQDKIRMFFN